MRHKRKLVIMSFASNFGGGEFYLMRLTDLLKTDCDILICSTDVGGLLNELAAAGATTVRLDNSTWIRTRWNLLVWAWSKRRSLRDSDVVVLYNGVGPAYFAPLLWSFLRLKGVLIAHTPTSLWRGRLRRIALFAARHFLAAVVGVSDTVTADVSRLWPGVPVFSIPNWLSQAEFDARRAYSVKAKTVEFIDVVVVSRVAPGKGIEHILAACADLPSILRLDVYGDGQLLPMLRSKYQELPHIQFHGMMRDVQRRLRSYDVLVTASSIDTFSYSTAEAILQGLLCVVTRSDVFRELLGPDYPDSLMFEYGDQEDLRRAICRARELILRDRKYVDHVISQAYTRIRNRNNPVVAKEKYDKLIAVVGN